MTYNISNMRVKEIKMTITPEQMNAIVDGEHELVFDLDKSHWHLNKNGEGFSMSGRMMDGNYEVEEINCSGEFSGTEWHEIVKPLLERTRAIFSALLVWEGGDIIERILVTAGNIEQQEVD